MLIELSMVEQRYELKDLVWQNLGESKLLLARQEIEVAYGWIIS